MARKGILTPSDTPHAPRRASEAPAPRGAVGALQSSLSRLQESAVQDIDPHAIHAAGVTDRLGVDEDADAALRESLRVHGQQVPVLVRPRADEPGQYDIVYGRRRVLAMRDLGLPVKAMVRQLDDAALVLAQGQENTARQDLSFIEKASFAAQLEALSYDRPTIAAALSMDLPMISRMLKVGRAFDIGFLQEIGSAPGIGRDRWLKLVEAMEAHGVRERVHARLPTLAMVSGSDARFEQVLAWATDAPAPKAARPPARTRKVKNRDGIAIARVKADDKALTLTLNDGEVPGFVRWLETQADDVINDLYDRWTKKRSED
tara:strand:+ start:6428 stop:7381 length:954 start_codon:yes stop_codon:yes gene_type:complete